MQASSVSFGRRSSPVRADRSARRVPVVRSAPQELMAILELTVSPVIRALTERAALMAPRDLMDRLGPKVPRARRAPVEIAGPLERKVIRARKVLAEPRVRPDLRVSKA